MNLGVILPHTKLYGGVKRFLELGNVFIERGHRFIAFTPTGEPAPWFDFKGEMKTFDAIPQTPLEALFITEVPYLSLLLDSKARHKIFYHVRQKEPLQKILKYPEVTIFACSTTIYQADQKQFGITPFKGFGGIDINRFKAKDDSTETDKPVTVMAYGRIVERSKGTHIVVKACERLYKKGYDIRLLLFDTPVNEKAQRKIDRFKTSVPHEFILNHPPQKNIDLFHKADIFVAVERKAGWCNTGAEAMACGIPLVASKAGTQDFLIDGETGIRVERTASSVAKGIQKFLDDEALRQKMSWAGRRQIEKFSWHELANRIINYLTHE